MPASFTLRELLEREHERNSAARCSAAARERRVSRYHADAARRSVTPICMSDRDRACFRPVRGLVQPQFGFEGGSGLVVTPVELRACLDKSNRVALAAPLVPVLRDSRHLLSQHQAVAETQHPASEYTGMRGQVGLGMYSRRYVAS